VLPRYARISVQQPVWGGTTGRSAISPQLHDRLYDAFPRLFPEHTLPVDVSPIGWGITCGDGWFGLLWSLCGDLQELIGRESEEARDDVRAVQVKEKLGGLRFYMRRATPAMLERIQRAEAQSLHVCDVCGDPGTLIRGVGLWRTRCADHPEHVCAYQ